MKQANKHDTLDQRLIILQQITKKMKSTAGKSRAFPRAKANNDTSSKNTVPKLRSRDKISRAMKRFGKEKIRF